MENVMLDKTTRRLLYGVRDRIASGKSQFICIAISDEAHTLNGEGEIGLPYSSCAEDIRHEIELALSGCYTFDGWLFSQTGYYPEDISENARENWSAFAYNGWHAVSRKQFIDWCY